MATETKTYSASHEGRLKLVSFSLGMKVRLPGYDEATISALGRQYVTIRFADNTTQRRYPHELIGLVEERA